MKQTQQRDERATAYALNELQGPEKEQFEKDLDSIKGLPTEVESIREFCKGLSKELQREVLPDSDARLTKNLLNTTEGAVNQHGSNRKKYLIIGLPVLLAAGLAALIVLPKHLNQTDADVGAVVTELTETAFVPAVPEAEDWDREEVVAAEPVKDDAIQTGPQKIAAPDLKKAKILGVRDKSLSMNAPAQISAAPQRRQTADKSPADGKGGEVADESNEFNTESYDYLPENMFKSPQQDALSTFSVDVDTASYANLRRFVNAGSLPPKDAVRIEEMINYFPYAYEAPKDDRPFAVQVEVAAAPWKPEHRLVKIGLKGKDVVWGQTPASNLVFLLDVSGSMNSANKLPLLKKALKMLVERLGQNDRVAIVVYAGSSGVALPSTSAAEKQKIMDALDQLTAGGSTNGAEGIHLAYKIAQEHFIKGGINRVIIATDGDFNVGTTSQGELVRLIDQKAKSGVFLSVLGFGMGNYKDATLEKLADKGNGNYAYIDTEQEARKVLVEEIGGTMMTIAKDVKIQVEFNPAEVEAYRLIGYENRVLAHQDFNNDAKDAGDIGAGHTVTAFYEVVPKGVAIKIDGVDPLKYQKPAAGGANSGEMMSLKLRYKQPDAGKSSLIEYAVKDQGRKFDEASSDFRFAASVAGVGMILRDSVNKGTASLDSMLNIAEAASESDGSGYRAEFSNLIRKIKSLQK